MLKIHLCLVQGSLLDFYTRFRLVQASHRLVEHRLRSALVGAQFLGPFCDGLRQFQRGLGALQIPSASSTLA